MQAAEQAAIVRADCEAQIAILRNNNRRLEQREQALTNEAYQLVEANCTLMEIPCRRSFLLPPFPVSQLIIPITSTTDNSQITAIRHISHVTTSLSIVQSLSLPPPQLAGQFDRCSSSDELMESLSLPL